MTPDEKNHIWRINKYVDDMEQEYHNLMAAYFRMQSYDDKIQRLTAKLEETEEIVPVLEKHARVRK